METALDSALANQVVSRLALCLRLATLHQLTNAALRQPMQALVEVVRRCTEHGDRLQVQVAGENVYVNRQAVRLDNSSFESAKVLAALYTRLSLQEIAFLEPIGEADLRELLAALQKHAGSANPADIALEQFRRISLVGAEPEDGGSLPPASEGHRFVRAYAALLVSLRRTHEGLGSGRDVRLGQLRRALHAVMELTAKQEPLAAALTRQQPPGDETLSHLVATAMLVLLLGRRLGLPRSTLTEVCLSALLHEARAAPGQTPEELAFAREKRPLRTVLQLTAHSTAPMVLHAARLAHECALPASSSPSGAARLVAVACAYDRLTRATADRRGLPSEQALATLAQDASGRLDARVVALLAEVVGVHPVGTVVRLSDGNVGLVIGRPEAADPQRVQVRLATRAGAPGALVEVDGREEAGLFVVGSLSPLAAGIPVLAWLLREQGTLSRPPLGR